MDISQKGPGTEHQRTAIKDARRQEIIDLYKHSSGPRLLGTISLHQDGLVMLLRETNHQQNLITFDMIMRVNPRTRMIRETPFDMYKIIGAYIGTLTMHLPLENNANGDPVIKKAESPYTPKEKIWPFEEMFIPLYTHLSQSRKQR